MKKFVSMILAFLIVFNFTIVNAKTENSIGIKEAKTKHELIKKIHKLDYLESGNLKISEFNKNEIELMVASSVLIFVAGIVVGYLIDGVIIYETGHSAGYWVSEVIRWVSADRRIAKIYVDSNDKVIRAEDNQRCYKSSYSGKWHCQAGPSW